ncbi:U1 small nuclear ribonucleoprotein C-like [Planococcus citri]|uniref:U1 small nuclear ribonucleoprotein C-like n=1 Tax=Planococcus citri TaxID=170843 RepID=UPI0031F9ADCF
MPKYYCDYCDTYLTHDSPSVRKTHCQGRKHKDNVKFYYQKWMEDQAQQLIDATTALYKAGKIAANPFSNQKGVAIPPPASLAVPPGLPPMPPMGMPPGMPQAMMAPPLPGMPPPGVGMMVPPIPQVVRSGPVPPMMMPIPPPMGQMAQMRNPLLTNPQMSMMPATK